jgi:UDP-N-acetylmuramoylalanine--D-glutamate ligase
VSACGGTGASRAADPLGLGGRTVVVLGLGDTGLSLARWLARRGARVRVADTRADPPHASTLARELPGVPLAKGAFSAETLRGADLVAISPGLDRRSGPVARAAARGVPVVGDVELFARALPHSRAREAAVLAVTGSNGKSTVAAMAGAICREAGRATVVAGNIGLPVLDALEAVEAGGAVPQVFVLELSSFQLESTESLAPVAAAMLNLTEDHLDRYRDLAEYAAAKARIFAGGGAQVLNRDDPWSLGMARPGRPLRTFGLDRPADDTQWGLASERGVPVLAHGARALMPLSELPLAGLHNAANALAAHALAHAVGAPAEAAARALRAFAGLPHRMQRIAELAGVLYLDDSKATNVGAAIAALRGLGRAAVLIAGGDGKGQDFAPLAPAVREHARAVVLIGRDAPVIERALAATGVPLERADAMAQAVEIARRLARPGDAVLLAPACASYDMYRNFAERGEDFAAAVRRIAAQEA